MVFSMDCDRSWLGTGKDEMTLRHNPEKCQSEGRVAQQGMGKRERFFKVKTRHEVEGWSKER